VGEPPSFADAVAQARAAMAGQRQWDGYITAPAVLAEALTGELAEIRGQLDGIRDDLGRALRMLGIDDRRS
jgi:hypothetical protein